MITDNLKKSIKDLFYILVEFFPPEYFIKIFSYLITKLQADMAKFAFSVETKLIHDDSFLSSIKDVLYDFSVKLLEEIQIGSQGSMQKAVEIRKALSSLNKTITLTIFEASLNLNYQTRTVNAFADILWSVIHLDGEGGASLSEAHEYLTRIFVKDPSDAEMVNVCLIEMRDQFKQPIKHGLQRFHEYFKKFINEFVKNVVYKDNDKYRLMMEYHGNDPQGDDNNEMDAMTQ